MQKGCFPFQTVKRVILSSILVVALAGLFSGCKKSASGELPEPKSPQEAATYLDQTFASAPPATRQNVTVASAAMRSGEYEKAVISLQTVVAAQNLTLDQGMAVYAAKLNLQRELIYAMERGDQNAKRAFELLKQLNRN